MYQRIIYQFVACLLHSRPLIRIGASDTRLLYPPCRFLACICCPSYIKDCSCTQVKPQVVHHLVSDAIKQHCPEDYLLTFQAPRCLPCGYRGNVTWHTGIQMMTGCPCTPDTICSHRGTYNGTFKNSCGVPRCAMSGPSDTNDSQSLLPKLFRL